VALRGGHIGFPEFAFVAARVIPLTAYRQAKLKIQINQ